MFDCSRQINKSSGIQTDQHKSIIKEDIRTKNIQGIVTDGKWSMPMTNMTVCSTSKKPQSTSYYPSDLD